jgi:hypothetical protein
VLRPGIGAGSHAFGWVLHEAAKPPSSAQNSRAFHAARQATRTLTLISFLSSFVQRPSEI